MAFLAPAERAFLQAVSKLDYCNPFLPERIGHEREALGPDFREADPIWSMQVSDPDRPRPNLVTITERIEVLVGRLREALAGRAAPADGELEFYEDGVFFLLYRRYEDRLRTTIEEQIEPTSQQVRLD